MTFRGRNVEKREVCSCKEGGEIKSKRREKPKKSGKETSVPVTINPPNTNRQSKQIIHGDHKWPFSADINETSP